MSKFCFTVRSFVFLMDCQLSEWFLPEGKQRVAPFYHPSIHQLSTLEKTKLCHHPTLSSSLKTCFQRLACGGLARDLCHGQQRVSRSVIFLSLHTQKTLTFVTYLHQAFWCRRWQSWGSPWNQTHHWSWLCCDSSFTCIFLHSFWHHVRAISRTEIANVGQTQKMIPFITCEVSLDQHVCELVLGVTMHLIWIFGSNLILSNNQSWATLLVQETCLIVKLLSFMIILITASLSSKMYNKASWWEELTFEEIKSTLSRPSIIHEISFALEVCDVLHELGSCTGLTVLDYSTIRSHKSRAGIPSNLNPASKETIYDSVELCETEVCFLHIQLIGTNVRLPKNAKCSTRSGFWVLKISRKIGVLKQSQPALFCSVTQ